MFCESCGKPVPANAPACPNCSPSMAPPSYGPPSYGSQGPVAPPPGGGYGGQMGGTPTQYGAPPQYGAPQQQYGAPQQQYGAPPQQQYGAPQQQYGAPQQYGPGPGGPPPYGGPPQGPPPGGGLADNMAGLLAYITIIPAIIFLLIDPYRRNPFVRFHAWQCLCLAGVSFVLQIGVGTMMAMMRMYGVFMMLSSLVGLLFFVAWVMCLVKAFQGEKFKLPVIGDFAEQMANKPM